MKCPNCDHEFTREEKYGELDKVCDEIDKEYGEGTSIRIIQYHLKSRQIEEYMNKLKEL